MKTLPNNDHSEQRLSGILIFGIKSFQNKNSSEHWSVGISTCTHTLTCLIAGWPSRHCFHIDALYIIRDFNWWCKKPWHFFEQLSHTVNYDIWFWYFVFLFIFFLEVVSVDLLLLLQLMQWLERSKKKTKLTYTNLWKTCARKGARQLTQS